MTCEGVTPLGWEEEKEEEEGGGATSSEACRVVRV